MPSSINVLEEGIFLCKTLWEYVFFTKVLIISNLICFRRPENQRLSIVFVLFSAQTVND